MREEGRKEGREGMREEGREGGRNNRNEGRSKQEQLGVVIENEVTSTSSSHVLLIFFSSTHILTHPHSLLHLLDFQ